MKKEISIPTIYDDVEDISILLKMVIDVMIDPDHSFTYNFHKCSFLSNTAIAILGAISNFIQHRYEQNAKNFLASQELVTHLSRAVLSAIEKDENIKKELSKKIQHQIAAMPQISPDVIRFQVMSEKINEMLSQKGEYQWLFSHYIHDEIENVGVLFNVRSMSNQLKNRLVEYNFLSHFSNAFTSPYPEGKYLGFRVHKKQGEPDAESIIAHIKTEWLTDDRVKLSPRLKEDVVSRIFELFQNAFGHGVRNAIMPIDVISCGDYDTQANTISLCIIDLGGGICKNVMNFISNKLHLAELIPNNRAALSWALASGNTTKTDSIVDDMPRGVGLELLKEFVHLNQGKLEIYTNDCIAFLNQEGEYEIKTLDFDFPGTLAKITINCNKEVIYSYEDESDECFF